MTYNPQPSDLIFYKSKSLLGRLIRFFTRGNREEKTFTNHVAGIDIPPYKIEALWKVERRPFNINTEIDEIEVWRNTKLGYVDKQDVAEAAYNYVGRQYGAFKIVTHMLDCLVVKFIKHEFYFFRRLTLDDRYPICSWVWAFAYEKVGYAFGVKPEYAQPDDMHDFVVSSSDWKLIYKKGRK